MGNSYCPRCGYDHGNGSGLREFADRHPAAAVAGGVGLAAVTLLFLTWYIAALALFPVGAGIAGLLAIVGASLGARVHSQDRKEAALRRFDWETEEERNG